MKPGPDITEKWCQGCEQLRPVVEFNINKTGAQHGHYYCYCRKCHSASVKASTKRNPFPSRMANKAWIDRNREVYNARMRKTNGGKRQRYRAIVLEHYGGKCSCCGEHYQQFLAIDHMDGGGSRHRREVVGSHLYPWLIRNGFPSGYRILCHNCNQARGSYGVCPHEQAAYDLPFAVRMEA